jgi:hypothetical protein
LRQKDRLPLIAAGLARAAALLLVVTLAACESEAEMRAQDETTCAGYGFKAGTTEYGNCLQRESLARRYGTPQPGWYGPGGGGAFGPGWYPPPPGWIW